MRPDGTFQRSLSRGDRHDSVTRIVRHPERHRGRLCKSLQGKRLQKHGEIAQLVEQRTENPRVVGSIPTLATSNHRPENGGNANDFRPFLCPGVSPL